MDHGRALLPESKAQSVSVVDSFGFQVYPTGQMVYITVSLRPISPYHPLSGIGRTYFFLPLESSLDGFSMGDSQISVLGPIQTASFTLAVWSSRRQIGPPSLGYSATGLQVISTNRAGPIPMPLMSSCCFYCMALISPVTVNQPISTEWSLHPEIVTRLFRASGQSNSGHVGHSPQHPSFPV